MGSGGEYVVAAYAVVLGAVLLYALVLGLRFARLAREAELLARLVEEERGERDEAEAAAAAPPAPDPVEVGER